MLKIHHLVPSRSDRIVWLAEELGIPYELVRHTRDPQTFRATESLFRISPLGKAPVIEDDGKTIEESALIVDSVLDRYGQGRLRPAEGTQERLDYDYWMHCSESTLMFPVLLDVLMGLTQTDAPGLAGFMQGEYATMFAHVDRALAKHDFIVSNELTGADVMLYYTLALGTGRAIPLFQTHSPIADHPRIAAYMDRLEQRPAFQKAKKLCA